GEIARGININLDTLPLKYTGLNGTELALSESQERMAVVVEAKDAQTFIDYAKIDNLEATIVAEVTADETMTMHWQGNTIVQLDRKFLDTNGVRKQTQVKVGEIEIQNPFKPQSFGKSNFLSLLGELNHASQKGMVELFDSNVGRSTVLSPF